MTREVFSIDVVFAFAFGEFEAGREYKISPNAQIYASAKNAVLRNIVPFATQKDVVLEDERLRGPGLHHILGYDSEEIPVYVLDGEQEPFPSTLQLIKRFMPFAETNKWKRVWVVAAPQQIKRCKRDLKRMGFIPIIPTYLLHETGRYYYSKTSLQSRTRNWFNWWIRESILRLIPWWLYKRVAG